MYTCLYIYIYIHSNNIATNSNIHMYIRLSNETTTCCPLVQSHVPRA